MNKIVKWMALFMFFSYLAIYSFKTAPVPLEETLSSNNIIASSKVIEILERENETIRALYTKSIVGDGKKQGILFDENWADEDVQAGLLPAQFLRETARFIEQSPVPLGLFLGSDNAINSANNFSDYELIMFNEMKINKLPIYKYDSSISRYSYMFPDVAAVPSCINCHNSHLNSPKKDWTLNQIMGATTWTYPNKTMSVEEALKTIFTLRKSFRHAYELTLEEARKMDNPPAISDRWPNVGYYLPTTDVFMDEFTRRISAETLNSITILSMNGHNNEKS